MGDGALTAGGSDETLTSDLPIRTENSDSRCGTREIIARATGAESGASGVRGRVPTS